MSQLIKSLFANRMSSLSRTLSNLSINFENQAHKMIINKNIYPFNKQFSSLSVNSPNKKKLIMPQNSVLVQQVCEFKTKMRLRKRCRSCYFLWKNGRIYVECKAYPNHRQHHLFSLENGYDNIAHGYHIHKKRKPIL